MEHFGASGRLSSYGAADLPGQDCNCCCSMGSGSVHLSATGSVPISVSGVAGLHRSFTS